MKHQPILAALRASRHSLTDQDRTELLAALLQGDLGGSDAWANAIWPVEKAFVDNYAAIERAQEELAA